MGRPLHNGVAGFFIVTGLGAPPARRPGVSESVQQCRTFSGRHFDEGCENPLPTGADASTAGSHPAQEIPQTLSAVFRPGQQEGGTEASESPPVETGDSENSVCRISSVAETENIVRRLSNSGTTPRTSSASSRASLYPSRPFGEKISSRRPGDTSQ